MQSQVRFFVSALLLGAIAFYFVFLRGGPDDRPGEAGRGPGFHPRFCPVARSLDGGIDVQTQLKFV